jgi:hypothetical protein
MKNKFFLFTKLNRKEYKKTIETKIIASSPLHPKHKKLK